MDFFPLPPLFLGFVDLIGFVSEIVGLGEVADEIGGGSTLAGWDDYDEYSDFLYLYRIANENVDPSKSMVRDPLPQNFPFPVFAFYQYPVLQTPLP